MTHVTGSPILTPTQVIINHLLGLPVDARNRLIIINRRIPPVILPIMRIHTLVLLMFGQVQNTELSLVVKHVKVFVLDVVVDQFGLDLLLAMGVCAEFFVRTL